VGLTRQTDNQITPGGCSRPYHENLGIGPGGIPELPTSSREAAELPNLAEH
jgi:hypothetical protein